MTPQQLKNSILQLAIQGKLVEQRPEEGTGQELFNQIQEEKQKLIAEGKIKNEKELAPITEDEIPFDIPENWEWTRIGLVTSYNQTKEKVTSTNLCNDTLVLDLEDIEKESGIILEKKLAKDKIIKGEKLKFTKGDILYSKLRPYLKKILIAPSSGVCSSEIVPFSAYGCLSNTYVMYFMKSPLVDSIANENSYGVKMPRVSSETICNIPIPLPPLEEQKRIVAKIEELLPYVDKYQEYYDELELLNSKFPGQLRKSILQYAIEGKLVEQRPEEGTGQDLFNQIQEEKQKLIAEGKIKKEKALAPITEDEIPFDIPESWRWCRLVSLFQFINGDRGKNYPSKDKLKTKGIPFISAINLKDGKILHDEKLMCLSNEQYDLLSSGKLQKNDIVICIRGSLGKHAVFTEEQGAIASSLVILRQPKKLNSMVSYVSYFIDSKLFFDEISQTDNGTAQPNLSSKNLENFIFPLPPLAEQKRIVSKVEELFALCDKLDLS